ncbi:MAG: VWA domain-containing protein [Gammaproteobacteria bacterium]|nr:VWA domain-containing protein [Gammaproteobacteria bacterium]
MKRRQRREADTFSLSFLDCICCGFGAVILLLVLNKVGEPIQLEQAREDLDAQIAKLQQELYDLRGHSLVLERELQTRIEQLSEDQRRAARLRGDLSLIRGQFAASRSEADAVETLAGSLQTARQSLTEEMKRLLGARFRRSADQPIGGIPVDSEHVVFVVDTSGSMQTFSWRRAEQKLAEVLDLYPQLQGIQVMDDMGGYMFPEYSGRWIPDSPVRRREILERFRRWRAFSNSSPVEGIVTAIRTFSTGSQRMSVFVFGDEFTGSSIEEVVDTVERINRADRAGGRLVRIHALGFPLGDDYPEFTGIRYATLMRILCARNGGTFVGLTDQDFEPRRRSGG